MDNLDKIRREIERALNESKEIFEVFNSNIRKDVSDGEVDKNERLSEEGGKENIAEENSGIDGILQKEKSLFSNWVNNYLKEPYNEYKKYIFVCLGIIVICLSANYYFQIPKKSDVERYLQKYDVENICIIFNKTMAYGDQSKIARSSAIEALVKIRNDQANKFLDKYILDSTSQDNIKKEILNKYSIFDPQYIDRKIENYRVKISVVNKDASFSECKKLFDELIKFSNNENSMQKITHALYIESIRFLLNPNMTNEVIEYFNTLSKYKDQSKTIKVIDKYIEQYEYVKKLKNEQSRISSRLDSIREERENILNKKHSSITGYITSQYDTTSYFFRDAYGLTGVLKTTVTVFTSPGMFTMDVLHIGETKDGFPLFIEDSSRKYDAVKMLELWQEENSLKEELSTMPSKIMSAEDVLAYLRSTLLNLRQEDSKDLSEINEQDSNTRHYQNLPIRPLGWHFGMKDTVHGIELKLVENNDSSDTKAYVCRSLGRLNFQDFIPVDKVRVLDNRFIFTKNKGEFVQVELETSGEFNEIRDYLDNRYGKGEAIEASQKRYCSEWKDNGALMQLIYLKGKDVCKIIVTDRRYFDSRDTI